MAGMMPPARALHDDAGNFRARLADHPRAHA